MSRDREDERGFASRWSRLKREAKAEPVEAEVEAEASEPEAPVDDDRPDEEVLEELGLPDPDTLKAGDNFSAFMARAVPARLRNRALRKLWISDPVLANLDELLDYGEDFTDAATVIENLQTAYQVGKGYIDKVAKLPEEDAGSGEETVDESAGETAGEATGEPPGKSAGKTPDQPPEDQVETSEETGGDDADPAVLAGHDAPEDIREKAVPEERPRPRQRMRFRLTEEL